VVGSEEWGWKERDGEEKKCRLHDFMIVVLAGVFTTDLGDRLDGELKKLEWFLKLKKVAGLDVENAGVGKCFLFKSQMQRGVPPCEPRKSGEVTSPAVTDWRHFIKWKSWWKSRAILMR